MNGLLRDKTVVITAGLDAPVLAALQGRNGARNTRPGRALVDFFGVVARGRRRHRSLFCHQQPACRLAKTRAGRAASRAPLGSQRAAQRADPERSRGQGPPCAGRAILSAATGPASTGVIG